jgi:TonB family protein
MRSRDLHHRTNPYSPTSALIGIAYLAVSLFLLAFELSAVAQTQSSTQPAPRDTRATPQSHATASPEVHSITQDELKQQLAGKTFYLREGYLDNSLQFDEHGRLINNSPRTSYTLSLIQIDKVNLTKHKLQLEGIRYGLHFLGAAPTEDPLQASDKVRITPKKKTLKITIARAEVMSRKREKAGKHDTTQTSSAALPAPATASDAIPSPSQNSSNTVAPGAPTIEGAATQAHANQLLKSAIDNIFSQGLDEKMISSLPDFWKLYYEAAAVKSTYKPRDPSIFRQDTVDQKARLITIFEPPSNDYAQNAGVAGVAMYHVVVAPDGKSAEIAVGRPIGFGLDENAVDSIRKASFQPAIKNGKPVPVVLDLIVQFRIYSKRTAAPAGPDAVSADSPGANAPSLPGPYSASQPPAKQQ